MKRLESILYKTATFVGGAPLLGLFVCGIVEAANHLITALCSGDLLASFAMFVTFGINLAAATGFACLGYSLLSDKDA